MVPLFSVPELDSETVDRQGFAMRIKRVDQDLLDTLLRSHRRTLRVIPNSLHTSPQSSYRFIEEEIEAQRGHTTCPRLHRWDKGETGM